MIPRIIHQTFETELTPPGMSNARESWRINNQNYIYKFYNANKRIEFIKKNFNSDVLQAYHNIIPGAFKADLFRYCVLYIQGGVYADVDTICLKPLSYYINKTDDLVVVRDDPMAKKWLANGFLACNPNHPLLLYAIQKAVQNIQSQEKKFYLDYTGPGLLGKSLNHVLNRDIETEYDLGIFNINNYQLKILKHNFSTTQFTFESMPVIHVEYPEYRKEMEAINNKPFYFYVQTNNLFTRKQINLLKQEIRPAVSHNLTIHPTKDGYTGVARLDNDTSRTEFMKKLGESKELIEYKFDSRFNVLKKSTHKIKNIQGHFKFEDYRAFNYKSKLYYSVAYLDENFNTYMGVLDSEYNFIGRIDIDRKNKMSFVENKEVDWEKNWLFFENKKDLYFIYSTTPNLIIYKCTDFNQLTFKETVNTLNIFSSGLPQDQLYFTQNITTGGSTNPIFIKEYNCFVYLIHTKIYAQRKYNHYLVGLDLDLKLTFLNPIPFISANVGYSLMFITTMVKNQNDIVISGGVEDNQNFVWQIPFSHLKIPNK